MEMHALRIGDGTGVETGSMPEGSSDGEVVHLRPDELELLRYVGGVEEWACLASAIRYIKSATVFRAVATHHSSVSVSLEFPDDDEGEKAGGGFVKIIEQEMEKRKCVR